MNLLSNSSVIYHKANVHGSFKLLIDGDALKGLNNPNTQTTDKLFKIKILN